MLLDVCSESLLPDISEEVCGYTVYKSSEVPFEVILDEPRSTTGAAHIIVTPGMKLNYEGKARYTFEVAAHDCEQSHHTRRWVTVYLESRPVRHLFLTEKHDEQMSVLESRELQMSVT